MKKELIACAALCVSSTISANVAELPKDTVKTQNINEALVLSNYKQQVILDNPLCEPASIASATSEVTKDDIEKAGATTVIEALKFTPGAWIESRGRKVKQLFSVRGQSYPYPTYTINGIYQKEFQEMSYFFNSANVQSVKVNRSSTALLNSLSALTGVIDIQTIKPTKREVRVFGKYGSLNSYHTGVSFADATEKISYSAAVNGVGTEGKSHKNGQESMWNAMGTFDWNISDKWSWGMNVFYVHGKRELVLPEEPADAKFTKQREEYAPYKAVVVGSKLTYKATDRWTSELQMNYAGRKPLYKSTAVKDGKVNKYKETDNEFTTNWINAIALSDVNTLRAGVLYNYWKAPKGKRFYYGKKGETHTLSGVVADQHSFGRWLVDGGFRMTRQLYAHWGGFNIEGGGKPFSKVSPIEDEWQSPEWQATAGVTYNLNDKQSLNFAYAGGIVTPRKGALNNELAKPDNETRMNFDLGYKVMFGPTSQLSLTAFWVNRANAIAYSGKTLEKDNGDIMELYKNVDMRNYGMEAAYQSPKFFNAFSLFTNATLMIGQVKKNGEWSKDDELPCFIANAGINFDHAGWDANAYVNYVGPYKNDRFISKDYLKKYGKAPLGDFATVDLTIGYTFGKKMNMRVFAEGKNLLNNKYQTCAGYTDNGILVSGGFDIRF